MCQIWHACEFWTITLYQKRVQRIQKFSVHRRLSKGSLPCISGGPNSSSTKSTHDDLPVLFASQCPEVSPELEKFDFMNLKLKPQTLPATTDSKLVFPANLFMITKARFSTWKSAQHTELVTHRCCGGTLWTSYLYWRVKSVPPWCAANFLLKITNFKEICTVLLKKKCQQKFLSKLYGNRRSFCTQFNFVISYFGRTYKFSCK